MAAGEIFNMKCKNCQRAAEREAATMKTLAHILDSLKAIEEALLLPAQPMKPENVEDELLYRDLLARTVH
jgi:hypothetical protein